MSSDKKFIRNPDIIDSPIDDEVVMMDVDKGAYFGLDSVGSQIWEELAEPHSLDALAEKLTQTYEVSVEQCKQDIAPLLEQMVESNLLVERS